MRGAISLGRLSGIKVYVHWTFFLLLIYISGNSYVEGADIWQTLIGIAFVLVIFACVTLHELGHALAARHYGINTRDIILLPIGGVARLEGIPHKPLQEIVVAVAGPLVNVAIAFILQVIFYIIYGVGVWQLPVDVFFESFWLSVLLTNLILVLFNAIPAFPMDGGRVLRAFLAIFINRPLATRIAAGIGQLLAVGFAIFGIYSGRYTLILTGLFIFAAARAESRSVQMGTDQMPEPYTLEDVDDIVSFKVNPNQSDEARQLLSRLGLKEGQFAVGRASADTGIILQTNNEPFRGIGEIYTVFDNFDAAETFALTQIRHDSNLKCWVENGSEDIFIYCKK